MLFHGQISPPGLRSLTTDHAADTHVNSCFFIYLLLLLLSLLLSSFSSLSLERVKNQNIVRPLGKVKSHHKFNKIKKRTFSSIIL